MKKYIMLLVSAVAMAFTSCSDSQDIEIIETGNVTFDVNTQSMYDEFDITNGIKRQILMDKAYAIAVKSFIYDQNGCLADSMTTYVYNTNSTQHSYTMLPNGKYTAVFIETVVYVDNDFQPFDYRIEGVDKLSTLQIEQISTTTYWWGAVGVETREFTVDEKQIQITPKALGSIINCRFFDFTDSPCLNVGLGTKENYIGYKLDPSLSEERRYMSELSETEYFALLGYTEVENDEATFDIYVLGKTLTYMFYYQTEETANTNNWNYLQKESKLTLKIGEKTYLAHAYDSNNGNVYDYYGTYSGMVSWYEALISGKDDDDDNGEPTPTGSSLVPEVNMKWGSTVSSVQSSMSGYTMSIGNSGSAILQNNGSYAIAYAGKNKEAMIAYFFTGERTGLYEADVVYPKSNVSQEELINYLESNYTFLASQDGMYMYCSSDFKTVGIVYENGDNWWLGFIDAEQLDSSKVKLPAYRLPERSTTHTGVTTIDECTKVSFSKVQECANDAVKNINTRIK